MTASVAGDDRVVSIAVAPARGAAPHRPSFALLQRLEREIADALFFARPDAAELATIDAAARLAATEVLTAFGMGEGDPRLALCLEFASCSALYGYVVGRHAAPTDKE